MQESVNSSYTSIATAGYAVAFLFSPPYVRKNLFLHKYTVAFAYLCKMSPILGIS